MLEQLGEVESNFAGYYKASNGKQNPLFNLPKDLTITLVSGYNVQMRHRIVTRWQELESKVSQPAIPQSLPEDQPFLLRGDHLPWGFPHFEEI